MYPLTEHVLLKQQYLLLNLPLDLLNNCLILFSKRRPSTFGTAIILVEVVYSTLSLCVPERERELAPARVALAGDVIPLKDGRVQALSEGLRQHLQKGENYAIHSSYAVSAILSSASINCKSRIETFQEILDQNSNYVAHKFNIRSCTYVDGSGNIHDVEVEDVQAPKADLLFPFAEKLIDGINQSQPRRRALMLFCLEYYNAHPRDALMLSIDQYGFDVLAKVPESIASNAQSMEYLWKEFRFSFKEEASDLEAFCNLLIGLEEEVLQSVRSYSGLH